MLTEHYNRMASIADFRKLFLHREGDEFITEGGIEHANAVYCEDGTRSLIMPGMEGDDDLFSPIGLTGHPIEGHRLLSKPRIKTPLLKGWPRFAISTAL